MDNLLANPYFSPTSTKVAGCKTVKKKVCTCCALHNSTNLGEKNLTKKKWIDMDTYTEDESYVYRLTFDCFADDLTSIRNEAEAYGTVIKCEREVIDNVEE